MADEPIPDDIMQAAKSAWFDVPDMADDTGSDGIIAIARAIMSECAKWQAELATLRARAEKAEGLLFKLSSVAGSVLVGVSIHNSRNAGDKIEGPLITDLADATHAARAALKGGE